MVHNIGHTPLTLMVNIVLSEVRESKLIIRSRAITASVILREPGGAKCLLTKSCENRVRTELADCMPLRWVGVSSIPTSSTENLVQLAECSMRA